MKKLISLLLVALTVLAPLGSLAETQYYNIADLRAQTPERWTQSYQTKWRTVDIDAEVRLPETDAVPILKVTYDVPETLPTAEESGWAEVEARYDALILYNGWKQAPRSVDGKRINQNAEAKETWRSGFSPEARYVPMSDITYGEICDMLRDQLTRFGYDPAQFELDTPTEMWAQHWFYYGYKEDVLPGQLFLKARQTFYDLPILSHIWSAVHEQNKGDSRVGEMIVSFDLNAGFDAYGDQLSHLYVGAAKIIETPSDDIPLCAFDKVMEAIEPEINAGHIRKIYEVELGYVVYNEPGVYYSDTEPLVEGRMPQAELEEATAQRDAKRTSACYYLRPMWQINCLWVETPTGKLRETASYTTDERNSLDYYQLLVDAQSGELMRESEAQDRCEFKGFLSWDDVNGVQ